MKQQLFLVGIFLEVLSTLSGTAGKQLIRLSELQRRAGAHSITKVTFGFGMVINTVAGPILDMAAYSFAKQSLIAPFGGLDVIWNAALAPWILKESLSCARIVACILILVGTGASAAFVSDEETDYTVDVLKDLLVNKRVLIYLGSLATFVFLNVAIPMRRPKGDLLRGVSLGVTAGVIAGNMFCVKATMELLKEAIIDGKADVFLDPMPYVVILGAAFFALSNLVFMTRALLEFEALFMVTVYEGSMVVSNCVSANVILLEMEGVEEWLVLAYSCCVMTVCVGMIWVCVGEAKVRSDVLVDEKNSDLGPLVKEVDGKVKGIERVLRDLEHASFFQLEQGWNNHFNEVACEEKTPPSCQWTWNARVDDVCGRPEFPVSAPMHREDATAEPRRWALERRSHGNMMMLAPQHGTDFQTWDMNYRLRRPEPVQGYNTSTDANSVTEDNNEDNSEDNNCSLGAVSQPQQSQGCQTSCSGIQKLWFDALGAAGFQGDLHVTEIRAISQEQSILRTHGMPTTVMYL